MNRLDERQIIISYAFKALIYIVLLCAASIPWMAKVNNWPLMCEFGYGRIITILIGLVLAWLMMKKNAFLRPDCRNIWTKNNLRSKAYWLAAIIISLIIITVWNWFMGLSETGRENVLFQGFMIAFAIFTIFMLIVKIRSDDVEENEQFNPDRDKRTGEEKNDYWL